jgi:hypothetical protein
MFDEQLRVNMSASGPAERRGIEPLAEAAPASKFWLFSFQATGTSHDHDGALGVRVRTPDGRYTDRGPAVDGAEIDHQHLIGPVVDQLVKRGDELDASSIAEVAAEHGVLEVIAVAAEQPVDLRASAIVRDVVGDEVTVPHGYLVENGG